MKSCTWNIHIPSEKRRMLDSGRVRESKGRSAFYFTFIRDKVAVILPEGTSVCDMREGNIVLALYLSFPLSLSLRHRRRVSFAGDRWRIFRCRSLGNRALRNYRRRNRFREFASGMREMDSSRGTTLIYRNRFRIRALAARSLDNRVCFASGSHRPETVSCHLENLFVRVIRKN